MTSQEALRLSGKLYGECAKLVSTGRAVPHHRIRDVAELLIGLGTASDWTRRSADLRDLEYERKAMNRSRRSHGISEMIRFNMYWTGMNALFSRDALLAAAGLPIKGSELSKFRSIFDKLGFPDIEMDQMTAQLHAVLKVNIHTDLSDVGICNPTTLDVLFYKYTPLQLRNHTSNKIVAQTLATGSFVDLDMPVLIYLMRNWSVHGGLIDSSFRNESRFMGYISTIHYALAKTHFEFANFLITKL